MGIAGTTAIMGIASKAPAVAPALASMSVTFDKLTRTLGTSLEPVFNNGRKFSFGEGNNHVISNWAKGGTSALADLVSEIGKVWTGITTGAEKLKPIKDLLYPDKEGTTEGTKRQFCYY